MIKFKISRSGILKVDVHRAAKDTIISCMTRKTELDKNMIFPSDQCHPWSAYVQLFECATILVILVHDSCYNVVHICSAVD